MRLRGGLYHDVYITHRKSLLLSLPAYILVYTSIYLTSGLLLTMGNDDDVITGGGTIQSDDNITIMYDNNENGGANEKDVNCIGNHTQDPQKWPNSAHGYECLFKFQNTVR